MPARDKHLPGASRRDFLCAGLASALLPNRQAAAQAAAPAQTSNPAAVCGTWVLQQVNSLGELERLRPAIERALATPALRGFALRVPWHAIDGDFGLLEAGLELARAAGVAFAVRFMAGRHAPERLFDEAGCAHYLRKDERVPTPFLPDGGPNLVFETAFKDLTARLADWCRQSGVRLLHMAWYGGDWAELNHGVEVRAAPGYSYEAWLQGHTRLIDLGVRSAGTDLAVEFPLSGHGPLNSAAVDLARHVVEQVGPQSRLVFVQANGWGPSAQEPDRLGEWGTPDAATEAVKDRVWELPILRGLQAIQPEGYDWPALYALVEAVRATYCEVYLSSFAAARSELLVEQIERFAERCRSDGPPMPKVG